MRLYFFNNMMLSQIQHGIQAGHAAVRLLRKYQRGVVDGTELETQLDVVEDWADNHETFIVLNVGVSDSMMALRRLLESKDNPFPWVGFKEPNIQNALTSLAVLLPEEFYPESVYWGLPTENLTPKEMWLVNFGRVKDRSQLA